GRGRADGSHKPVAVAPHRLDDHALRPSIAQHLADLIQAVAQRVLFVGIRRSPRPELLTQIVLSNGPTMPLHEIRQHLKRLRSERDRLPSASQFITLGIQLTIAKHKSHAAVSFCGPSAASIKRLSRHLCCLTGGFLTLYHGCDAILARTKCSITEKL